MLDLEDSALWDGKAGYLPGMPNDNEIKIHLLVSTHPRGYYPPVHIVDVLFWEPPVSLFPRYFHGVGIRRKLDDGELESVRDLDTVDR